jgi:peptidoglycan/LPS O-acetylase OafA/YrhL
MAYIPAGVVSKLSRSYQRTLFGIFLTMIGPFALFFSVGAVVSRSVLAGVVAVVLLFGAIIYTKLWWSYRPPTVTSFHLYGLSVFTVAALIAATLVILGSDPDEPIPNGAIVLLITSIVLLVARIILGFMNRRAQKRVGVYDAYHAPNGS